MACYAAANRDARWQGSCEPHATLLSSSLLPSSAECILLCKNHHAADFHLHHTPDVSEHWRRCKFCCCQCQCWCDPHSSRYFIKMLQVPSVSYCMEVTGFGSQALNLLLELLLLLLLPSLFLVSHGCFSRICSSQSSQAVAGAAAVHGSSIRCVGGGFDCAVMTSQRKFFQWSKLSHFYADTGSGPTPVELKSTIKTAGH